MRIKLICLACGHSLELGDAYLDYTGEIKCWVCHAFLNITLSDGQLRSMRMSNATSAPQPAAPQTPEPQTPDIDPVQFATDQEAS